MERRMGNKEPKYGGTMKQNGSGEAGRPLPSNEQLTTRCCARCAGLLVNEWYYDLHNTGEDNIQTLRCVQCGHRIDPIILQNQVGLPVETQHTRQVRHRYFVKTVMSSEDA